MKKTLTTLLSIALLSLSFFSCKKENIIAEPDPILQVLPTENSFKGAQEFVEGHNAILNIINLTIGAVVLTPEFHGLTSSDMADTRSCPNVVLDTMSSPRTLTLHFNNCTFSHPLSTSTSQIDGTILFESFGDSLTQPGFNNFIKFDEVKINDKIIRLVGPNSLNKWIKLEFQGNVLLNDFKFEALFEGTPGGGDPVLDRNRFEVVDCDEGDSTVIYPLYDPNVAFFVNYTNPDTTSNPPTLNYLSLAKGCYEFDMGSLIGRYFNPEGDLVEDYTITKYTNPVTELVVGDPIIFKPFCEWIIDGQLQYTEIPNGANGGFMDEVTNTPFQLISYNADENGASSTPECDPYVMVEACDEFFQNAPCPSGYNQVIHDCSE